MLVLDWFVFDSKSKTLRGNPLEVFLKEAELDGETKQLCRNFRQGKFSLFEVKTIRIGKGMLLINLLDGQEHDSLIKSIDPEEVFDRIVREGLL